MLAAQNWKPAGGRTATGWPRAGRVGRVTSSTFTEPLASRSPFATPVNVLLVPVISSGASIALICRGIAEDVTGFGQHRIMKVSGPPRPEVNPSWVGWRESDGHRPGARLMLATRS